VPALGAIRGYQRNRFLRATVAIEDRKQIQRGFAINAFHRGVQA
jgi:hypothetical protein